MHGLWVLNKPVGWSSRGALDRAARWLPRRTKLGHAGTLDPLASGVLVATVGVATRLTEYVQRMAKTYEAEIHFGATSTTDDAEGILTPTIDPTIPSLGQIEAALSQFQGHIEQTPPQYSAAKIAGKRAYELARKGRQAELAPRSIRIDAIRIMSFDFPKLRLTIDCGKGTYIRALARDLGETLGCGGYLTELTRTRIGCFHLEQALSWEFDRAAAASKLLPIEWAVRDFPSVVLSEFQIAEVRQGRAIRLEHDADELAGLAAEGNLVAVLVRRGELYGPDKVFAASGAA